MATAKSVLCMVSIPLWFDSFVVVGVRSYVCFFAVFALFRRLPRSASAPQRQRLVQVSFPDASHTSPARDVSLLRSGCPALEFHACRGGDARHPWRGEANASSAWRNIWECPSFGAAVAACC